MVKPKDTLNAYRAKITAELQKSENIKARYIVVCVELKAQLDLINGLLATLYPSTPEKPVVDKKRK